MRPLVSPDPGPVLSLSTHPTPHKPRDGWVGSEKPRVVLAQGRAEPDGWVVSCPEGTSCPSLRPGPAASRHRRGTGGPWEQVALAGEPEIQHPVLETHLRGLPDPPLVGADRGPLRRTVSLHRAWRVGVGLGLYSRSWVSRRWLSP